MHRRTIKWERRVCGKQCTTGVRRRNQGFSLFELDPYFTTEGHHSWRKNFSLIYGVTVASFLAPCLAHQRFTTLTTTSKGIGHCKPVFGGTEVRGSFSGSFHHSWWFMLPTIHLHTAPLVSCVRPSVTRRQACTSGCIGSADIRVHVSSVPQA